MVAQWTCEECGRKVRTAKHRTVLGRTVCASCSGNLTSAQLGMLAGGGDVGRSIVMTKAIQAYRGLTGRR